MRKPLQTLAVLTLVAAGCASPNVPSRLSGLPVRYHNPRYGLTFFLPAEWRGHSILFRQQEAPLSSVDYQTQVGTERWPVIVLRHPQWRAGDPYQDIPIMVFTRTQWDANKVQRFFSSAGGYDMEIAHNDRYVFAVSSRFNWWELKGWEEAGRIVEANRAANAPHLYQE